jgi:sulfate permease, SulP family
MDRHEEASGDKPGHKPAWLFASLRGYEPAWLPRDAMAGLMLVAIALPGQLATARLAGMPAETGLISAVT